MKSVLIAPRKYVQGRGVLEELGEFLRPLGKKAIVLWDECVKGIVGDTVALVAGESGKKTDRLLSRMSAHLTD